MKPADYIALFAMVTVSGFTALGEPVSPPNLIIILTEDQGYHDVGFNGCKDIPTPNLDSIASNGVRFTSGYVASPLSSPSRAGLLTGRYPERFGYESDQAWQPNNPGSGLPMTETTLADVLGKAGYETGIIGKWHLGSNPAMHPLKRGFKEFFGFLGAGHRYFPEELTIDETRKAKTEYDSWLLWIMRNDEPVQMTNYLTDEFSDEAVRFIARHKEKPFFLLLAYNAPHDPQEATEKYLSRFPQILGSHRRTYAAMMSAVDYGVGSVLAELRKYGLEQQTLVVYLSASGGALDANSSDNYPLRGSREGVWEGGWRVPFAMQWPGHLPKGMVYGQPVLSLDIFATIATLANAPINPERPLDGVNLVPYLTGLKTGAPHDAIYLRIPYRGAFAVRSGEYKLVVPATDQAAELYNIARDISECKNLADEQPEVIKELEKKHAAWSQRMIHPDTLENTEPNEPLPIDTDAGKSKPGP
jgi:arylsulfatase A-like enzyme